MVTEQMYHPQLWFLKGFGCTIVAFWSYFDIWLYRLEERTEGLPSPVLLPGQSKTFALWSGYADPRGVVREILRVRCYGGEISGQLGPGSASSLTSLFFSPPFQRRTITSSDTADPTASRSEPDKVKRSCASSRAHVVSSPTRLPSRTKRLEGPRQVRRYAIYI